MKLGFVGCGFASDGYVSTLCNHPRLQLVGVTDLDRERADRFAEHHGVHAYPSTEALLADPSIEIVVNLTPPESHHAISRAALEAGKHVYSEKPLTTSLAAARELVALAESRGLRLSAAPCSVLGQAAQTAWRAVREGTIGRPLLAVAEISDGFLHGRAYRSWRNRLGVPWPYASEFRTGCTLEHAAYSLTWFASMFGPARFITTFGAHLLPNPFGPEGDGPPPPDHAVACVEFDGGIVARITCSIIAPSDRSLTLVGEKGVLRVADTWKYDSPVRFTPHSRRALRWEKHPWIRRALLAGPRRVPRTATTSHTFRYRGNHRMDYARGIAELAESIEQARPCRLSARMVLHVTELMLAMDAGAARPGRHALESAFEAPEPLP